MPVEKNPVPELVQRRLPSRHKLVAEKSQLIKVPSDPALRARMPSIADIVGPVDTNANTLASSLVISQIELNTIAPDVLMTDLARPELHIKYDDIHFEESNTHVSAIGDFTNGTEGFSKGQVIEVLHLFLFILLCTYSIRF